jgi:hypothetical protein
MGHFPFPLEVYMYLLTALKCVLWCLALSEELENAFLQWGAGHVYGLSPVWDLMWIFKFSRRENAFPQPGCWKNRKVNINCKLFTFINQKLYLWFPKFICGTLNLSWDKRAPKIISKNIFNFRSCLIIF